MSKKIVLCGSKRFKDKVFEIEKELISLGYHVVVPKEFIVEMPKKDASLLHFNEIDKSDVDALLIVNGYANNQENYIGANTFAELAFGFYKGKKIFLLNGVYEPYKEELEAWDTISLNGDINKINIFYEK